MKTNAPKVSADAKTSKVVCSRCRQCKITARDTKTFIYNGLELIRARFSISKTDLPQLKPAELSKFLLFLTSGSSAGEDTPPCSRRGRMQRLGRRQRWEFAHSVNSLKRNLPAGCRRHAVSAYPTWKKQATSLPPPSPPEFLAFVRKKVRSLFPFGWDRDYYDFVINHRPNASARADTKKHAAAEWKGRQSEFIQAALGRGAPESFSVKYTEVLSAGKIRPLTIYPTSIEVLAPLHKLLYRHLQRKDWLLSGPPTESIISAFAGDFTDFTSIDLVNATDNLSLEVSEAILGSLLAKSRHIPGKIKLSAFAALHPVVNGEEVTHGQMMGSYLSFPLLCLHSYLAASYSTRGMKASILVNGDDTAIGTNGRIGPYPEGYKQNELKTIKSRNVIEINSTVFTKTGEKWREVHHLRRGAFGNDYASIVHIAAAVNKVQWQNAYWRHRFHRKWNILPSQLGHFGHIAARVEKSKRRTRLFTALPTQHGELDSNLETVYRDISNEEKLALNSYKWCNVDEGRRKRDSFSLSKGEVRKSFRYRKIRDKQVLAVRKTGVQGKVVTHLRAFGHSLSTYGAPRNVETRFRRYILTGYETAEDKQEERMNIDHVRRMVED